MQFAHYARAPRHVSSQPRPAIKRPEAKVVQSAAAGGTIADALDRNYGKEPARRPFQIDQSIPAPAGASHWFCTAEELLTRRARPDQACFLGCG